MQGELRFDIENSLFENYGDVNILEYGRLVAKEPLFADNYTVICIDPIPDRENTYLFADPCIDMEAAKDWISPEFYAEYQNATPEERVFVVLEVLNYYGPLEFMSYPETLTMEELVKKLPYYGVELL